MKKSQPGYVSPLKGKKRPPFSVEWKARIAASRLGKPSPIKIKNDPKQCIQCGGTYSRRSGVPQKQWRASLFCSVRCKGAMQKQTSVGKKHTDKTRLKMRASAKRGAESHLWRGGITGHLKYLRNSVEYKLWRDAVYKRDNWTCVWCNKRGGSLQADHIKPFAYFPELRFAIDNGRTLCVKCHLQTDTFGERAKQIYG